MGPSRAGNARDIFINNSRDINNVGLVQRCPYLQMIFHEQGCLGMRVSANKPKEGEGGRGRRLKNKSVFQAWGDPEARADISDSASLAQGSGVGGGESVYLCTQLCEGG